VVEYLRLKGNYAPEFSSIKFVIYSHSSPGILVHEADVNF